MADEQPTQPVRGHQGLRLLVTLGVGLWPGAPGTYASILVAVLAWAWLILGGAPLAGPWYGLAGLGLTGLAVASADRAVRLGILGPDPDPGAIVIDEAVGMLLALYGCASPGWPLWAALAAFRVFDIAKPWPVGWSQRLPGGWGIVADDVLAGLYALAVARLLGWLLGF
ncbi:MAG: phosphatidylglycerophosphatase A [Pseudomonadota bacterium]